MRNVELYEDPRDYLADTNDGREVFCQRLTTTLIVEGYYPRYGHEHVLTEKGTAFFQGLDRLSFGTAQWATPPVFIDEITMPKRHDAERGASPDWTLIFDDRIWIIELKTEPGNHRAQQLTHYLDLAAHYYPGRTLDITYLTGPLTKPPPTLAEGQRYVHLTWDQVLPLYEATWGQTRDPKVRRYLDVAHEALSALSTPWLEWRTSLTGITTAEPQLDPFAEALELCTATAEDRAQRALDYDPGEVQDLHDLRLQVRDHLRALPTDSPLHHVLPWVWTPASLGQPLTEAGQAGAELRVSYYKAPVT